MKGKISRREFLQASASAGAGLLLRMLGPTAAVPVQADTITFTGVELLGKPTDTSIAINIVPASTIE